MKKLKEYLTASYTEVTEKVTWPSYASLQASALLVLIATLIFALVVGSVDMVVEQAMTWLYSSF